MKTIEQPREIHYL